jgi:nucleolar protein 6
MSTKLSKRKQKALAFRGKKSKADGADELDAQTELEKAIPLDDPAEVAAGDAEQKPSSSSSWLGKDIVKGTSTKTKRKREETQDTGSENKSKKPKTGKSKTAADGTPAKIKPPAPKRFIVFIGNLPRLPPAELTPLLTAHFPVAPIHIRAPTKKGTDAPQGYAFAEFDSSTALEKALRCHHTVIGGRKINVELTAGGGGKSANRMGKIKGKNEGLEEERKKRVEEEKKEKEKEKAAKKEVRSGGIHPDRLKRIQV